MNQKINLKQVYFAVLIAVSIVASALRTLALFLDFDMKSGHFNGKALIGAGDIVVSVGCIFLFTYVFIGGKKEKLIASFTTPHTYVPAGTITVALLFFAFRAYEKLRLMGFSIREKPTAATLPEFTYTLLVPLAILSIGYFILNAAISERASSQRAVFGVFAVVFFTLYALYLYFDTTLAINAPNKVSDQMAYVFAALFLLYEIRISIGRECWHLYSAFGYIAVMLTAYSSIPSIILYLTDGTSVSNDIHENVLSLCVCIFIAARLALAIKLPMDKESESAVALRAEARARDAVITEKEEISRAAMIELYNRMLEIEEMPEDVDENALFYPAENGDGENGTEPTDEGNSDEAINTEESDVNIHEAEDEAPKETAETNEKEAEATEAEDSAKIAEADATPVDTKDATEANAIEEATEADTADAKSTEEATDANAIEEATEADVQENETSEATPNGIPSPEKSGSDADGNEPAKMSIEEAIEQLRLEEAERKRRERDGAI